MKKILLFCIALTAFSSPLVPEAYSQSGLPGAAGVSSSSEESPQIYSPLEATTCEGEKLTMTCNQNEVLKITDVFWGRDDYSTCANAPAGLTTEHLCETNSENSFAKVNAQCDNQQSCEVVASNIFFDDNSCGNVYKCLKVAYECVPDETQAVDILLEGML